ncbi:MAG TPA: helix-turn-helix transcriptional regulator [Polyangiaceae bacterium]
MTERLPSNKETLILEQLIEHGPLYGLEMVGFAKGALKRGTIYVTLSRMQDKGLVQLVQDQAPDGHAGLPRPRYRVTALGKRALRANELVRSVMRPARGTL